MKEPIIFVGSFEPRKGDESTRALARERKNLIRILQEQDISVRISPELWPRDTFVYNKRKIHRNIDYGNYADGGYVLNFPEFTLACEGIGEDSQRELTDSAEIAIKKLKGLYGTEVELLPNPNLIINQGEKHLPHVDLVILAIPERKVAFIDQVYYKKNQKRLLDFCERRGLKLETASCDYSKPAWPCNSLVIPGLKNLLIISPAQKDKTFVSKLRKYDVKCLELPFGTNGSYGGGIHCATNMVAKGFEEEACRVFYE